HYNLQYPQFFELFKKFLLLKYGLREKESLVEQNKLQFKTKFTYENFITEIDALNLASEGWELYVLKPIANSKKINLLEAAYNFYILTKLGWDIKKIQLVTVNSKYLYKEQIFVNDYFVVHEITDKVLNLSKKLEENLHQIIEYLNYKESETHKLPKCKSLKECRNIKFCYGIESPQILELREIGSLLGDLVSKKIFSFEEIPPTTELSKVQKIQIESTLENREYINQDEINYFIKRLSYPIYFLDFETINPVVPLYENSKPFEHIPFLFCLFIQRESNAEVEEICYVEDFQSDPRKKILEILSQTISKEGSIVCYNDLIEKGCLRNASEIYSEYKEWFHSIQDRFFDISLVFKNLHYYHPKQKGRASLKSILEPLTGLNYEDLEIKEGEMANLEFLRMKIAKEISLEEKQKTLNQILLYCKRDAWALVKILERLKGFTHKLD
ncbi:MAG: DUF2779 domain-containing protein, partial [Candidatus Pacearchaeota archaeon]